MSKGKGLLLTVIVENESGAMKRCGEVAEFSSRRM